MKSSDVAIYAITSQPQEEADKVVSQWGLHYRAIGDPDHNLAHHLKEKGLLDVVITTRNGYPNGMAQPGVAECNPSVGLQCYF